MIHNNFIRKIRKFRAISYRPKDVYYDGLVFLGNKSESLKKWTRQNHRGVRNNELLEKKFRPVSMEELSVQSDALVNQPAEIETRLEKFGICVLGNFISRQIALNAGDEISRFLEKNGFLVNGKLNDKINGRKFGFEKYYGWQYDYAKYRITDYRKVQALNAAFLNIRSSVPGVEDAGKIDVFHFEKLAETYNLSALKQCHDALHDKSLVSFLERVSGYKCVQPNLYFDSGVTHPRGPHIDNNLEQYKIFLYLTDVLDPRNGPYCYVPGSHKNRGWMSIERLINFCAERMSTDVSSFPPEYYTKLLAPAGTAIISQQSGIHGGWPQTVEGRRVMILGNYN